MSAPSSNVTATGNVVVVTQVRRNVLGVLPPPPGTPSADNYVFSRGRAVAVGSVQIVVGLVILLCGIINATRSNKLAVNSGAFVWGPLMFIIAGSLTVAAGSTPSRSLINTAVGFSVAAAMTAIVATVIFFLDVSGTFQSSYPPFGNHDQDMGLSVPLSGFSAVFSFLEFGLSAQVAASSCRCSSISSAQDFTITNQMYGTASMTVETPPTHQTPPAATAPPPPYEKPPEYNSIMA